MTIQNNNDNTLARLELAFVQSNAKDSISHARSLVCTMKCIDFLEIDEGSVLGVSLMMTLIDILLEQSVDLLGEVQ